MARLRATATIRVDDRLNQHGAAIPPVTVGNQSLAYEFDVSDPESAKPVRLRGVIESVGESLSGNAEELEPGTGGIVRILFWADRAALHATAGKTFSVFYGNVVGEGQIISSAKVPDENVRQSYDLTDAERQLLMNGINEWGGPGRCSDAMARAMGFENVRNLWTEGDRLREHIRFAEPMSVGDWARSLGATEVCFASSLGSTTDWEITTGFTDARTIELIRGLQIKLIDVRRAMRDGDLF